MELSLPLPLSANIRQEGALPIILASLVSAPDDARGFRRHPTALEAGIRLDAERASYRQCQATHNDHSSLHLNYRSVFTRDFSLTGLYFVSALPYRVGLLLEVRVSLPTQVLHLPAVVRRLDVPAHTGLGRLETAFGCGVDFRYQETSARSRRALMEYLLCRSLP